MRYPAFSTIIVSVASLFSTRSERTLSKNWMSSFVSCRKAMLERRIVDDLTGHGEKGELSLESTDRRGLQRKEVEEQCSVAACCQRRHLTLGGRLGHLNVGVNLFEVGGLAALGRTVIDDLKLKFL